MEIQTDRFVDLKTILNRTTPFPYQGEQYKGEDVDYCLTVPILVVGAGGLGCEILKNLALSGFKDIHVIDIDTIDLTNLNRQFLFRMSDVGKAKAVAAANFIMNRVPQCQVTPYTSKIQKIEEEHFNFYQQFPVIIAGLDNVEARRWLNQQVHKMVSWDDSGQPDPSTQRAFIDGGTQGLQGQARVVIPYQTSCYTCTESTLPPQTTYALCTISNNPTKPEHCIAWAYMIQWEKEHGKKVLDKDDPVHMTWVNQTAQKRAKEFNIEGVDYFKTMGVVQNIIPAVASTNAIIAACCTNEALQFLTHTALLLSDYFSFMGHNNIYPSTYPADQKKNCPVCSRIPFTLEVAQDGKVNDQLYKFIETYQMVQPTIMNQQMDYIVQLQSINETTDKTWGDVIEQKEYSDGEYLYLDDSQDPLFVVVIFKLKLV